MPRLLALLLAFVIWPRLASSQSVDTEGSVIPYWKWLQNGLPSVHIAEAVLLFRHSARPDARPFDGDLEAIVADSGARMWLRARLSWLMLDPVQKQAGKRWTVGLTGLRAGAPADSADAVMSAVVADGVILHTEEYLLIRRPGGATVPEEWAVARVRENDAEKDTRPEGHRAAKSPRIDSLLIRLDMGKAAASQLIRQDFVRHGLVPIEMTPSIFEAELTPKSLGVGCTSSHGCIRAILLDTDSTVSVLLLGDALTGNDNDVGQKVASVVGGVGEVAAGVLSLAWGGAPSGGVSSSKYRLRVDNKAGGTRGQVWRQLVDLASQLDSAQVPAAARTP